MGKQSTFRSRPGADERPILTPRQAALTAGKYHLLGAVSCVTLWVVFELPALHFAFVRLGWWLAPWRDFPLPYDRADFPWAHGPLHVVVGTQLIIIIAFFSAVVLVHGAAFRATALLHRWFGWPQYWPDVNDSISLRTAWAESARRSWWFWPAVVLIGETMSELAAGLRYAMYSLIVESWPFLIAGVGTIVLGYCYTSALALRKQVVVLIGREERRCVKCDYRLRGLQTCRCPECGRPFDPSARPEFRFKRERFDGRGRLRKFVLVLLPIASLAAPLLVPLAILGVPRPWLRWIPLLLQPGRRVLYHDPDAFPIRLDAVCRIRSGEELCLVRFWKLTSRTTDYVAGYWSGTSDLATMSPSMTTAGRIRNGGGPNLTLGPWSFRYSYTEANMIWLSRPDASYKVEAMLVEDFDGDLSWAEEDHADRP